MTHTQVPLTDKVRQRLQDDIDAQSHEMCIVICDECTKVCSEVLSYALREGGVFTESRFIKSLISCSEICALNAIWMARNFELHNKLCQTCADICERCAHECEHFATNKVMSECADICRRCAQSCLRMASH